ncbi:hypothetical protein [Streptomyces noursei]|uniref:hypothetical protein n=1 Tax=Streptomyces noursei TaxID=1971 RepID=UPI001676D41E|nr:hypothetical protein [Streptomyces noursei]MCZ1014413.1 hypothetical protein [Streptomyces noursei]GGW94836.1 hypothetical protein GCM10010341_14990 [Streptomyces noursei]
MLRWAEATAYGAGGGLIVEAVVTYGRLRAWQQARHAARVADDRLPRIGKFVDPPADSLAALFRVMLGSVAGWLLHAEITGVYAAVTVGASAPALLAQLGRATTATDALRANEPSGSPAQADPPELDPVREASP